MIPGILAASRRVSRRLPPMIGDAPEYGAYDPGVISPDDPDYAGTPPFMPAPGHPSHPKTRWGDVIGDIVAGGIAAGATPNIAGGGGTDMMRALSAAQQANGARRMNRYEMQREAEQDAWNRVKQRQQMQDWQAQAELRRARAKDIGEPEDYINAGAGKLFNRRTGKWEVAPSVASQASASAPEGLMDDPDRVAKLAMAGAYQSPERENFDIPAPAGSPMPNAMSTNISNVPPPEGYNAIPGTSGQNRIVLPGAELRGEISHPVRPVVRSSQDAQGNVTDRIIDPSTGETVVQQRGPIGRPSRPSARAPKTAGQRVAENTAAADEMGLKGEERKYFIANGRLPSKAGGKSAWKSEIDDAFGTSTSSNPKVDAFLKKHGLK